MDKNELQEIVDYILQEEGVPYPCPVVMSTKMKNCLGRARSRMYRPLDIRLAQRHFDGMSDEWQASIVIHEACHIVLHQREYEELDYSPAVHGPEFMGLSNKWHKAFGIYEERKSRTYHGKVYRVAADGTAKPVDRWK